MKLEKVKASSFPVRLICCACGRSCGVPEKDGSISIYADLDGEPFRAYYCAKCAANARAKERSTRP